MKKQRILSKSLVFLLVAVVLAILALPALVSADYQRMNPPPDVDKSAHGDEDLPTGWLATAANMLAGAGYGHGTNVQRRADEIYDQLFEEFGDDTGWPDEAIDWWIWESGHNDLGTLNPYTFTYELGRKTDPPSPWNDPWGPYFVAYALRRHDMVGLGISRPDGTLAHFITVWGDSGDADYPTTNPDYIIVTDSDKDTGGDVQTYNCYTCGDGWCIDYGDRLSYVITYLTTLSARNSGEWHRIKKLEGSVGILQDRYMGATDLHYRVGTIGSILTYRTTINWDTDKPPIITEGPSRFWLTVDWDLSENPVREDTWVTITTEFVLPNESTIYHEDVYFTYPRLVPYWPFPAFEWRLITPPRDDTNGESPCGGYVVGSFDLFDLTGQNLIGEYRFLQEYDYFQDPELHYFSLMATGEEQVVEALVGNLRFGHSYSFLDADLLWEFQDWMTCDDEIYSLDSNYPIKVELDWDGRLPYPPPPGVGPPIPMRKYNLTVGSTAGGNVTTPGEGTLTYDEGTVVCLIAQAEEGYRFVNWTGAVGTIANVQDASTAITMEGNYQITANFWEGDPCFIATAAYGTPMAEEIQILREFRDEYLLTNPLGQALTNLYYRVSPPIAEFIAEHPSLKPIVRAGLLPAMAMATVAVNTSPTEKMAIVGLLVLLPVATAVLMARRRNRGREYVLR